MASDNNDPEDPFKRFKRRDTSNDEDTETFAKRKKWEEDIDDDRPKPRGGPPILLLLGILGGFFTICGCCGVSGYGLYATGLFSSGESISLGNDFEIYSLTKSRMQTGNAMFGYKVRANRSPDSSARYYIVFQTGPWKDEAELRVIEKGDPLGETRSIFAAHYGTTSVWIERRRGGTVKKVSKTMTIN